MAFWVRASRDREQAQKRPRESQRGKTPGHLGWGKVQNIRAGGEGLAVHVLEVSDGKLKPWGTGSLAGNGLGEEPQPWREAG